MTAPATETADVPTSSATTPAVPQAPASPLERFGSRKVMAALVVGVLALQLGFILSYVAAFHQPTPRDISVAVVAGPGVPAGIPQQSSTSSTRSTDVRSTPAPPSTPPRCGSCSASARSRVRT